MAGFVKESYFPIWNAGSSSHDTNSGPGCTLAAFTVAGNTLASFMDANGGPIATAADLDCESSVPDAAGDLVIRKTGLFTSVLDGTYCYINFADTYTDGYYEVHKLDNDTAKLHPKTATVAVDSFVAWIANTDADNVIYIGGAFDTQNGFQTADMGGSATQNHWVYTRGNETVTASVVYAKGGERDVNKWTRYIGVDASWVPLTQGNYACIYGNQDPGQAMHDDHLAEITSTTVENMRFENLQFENTGADSADAATAMCFNKGNSSLGGHVFKNCYFKKGYNGYSWTATPVSGDTLINCVVEDCQKFGIRVNSYGSVSGCYVFATGNCTILAASYGILVSSGVTISNCVVANLANVTNKQFGYGIGVSDSCLIKNNSVYGLLTAGIYVSYYPMSQIINNIIHVKTPGTSKAISADGESYIELNNITNDTAANCGFIAGSGSDLAITATDPWVNAAAGDFRLNRGQSICDNYVIDKGFVPYVPSSIAGKTSLGAYAVGDIPNLNSVITTDSVMGTTGTFDSSNSLQYIRNIMEADTYIDKETTPWQLVYIDKDYPNPSADLMRFNLLDINGNNITSATTVIGQIINLSLVPFITVENTPENNLEFIKNILEGDKYIDITSTPWQLVIIDKNYPNPSAELMRKNLFDVDGNNLVAIDTVIGQIK